MPELMALLAKIPAPIVGLVSDLVRAIVGNPSSAARVLEEATRQLAFDAAMSKVLPAPK